MSKENKISQKHLETLQGLMGDRSKMQEQFMSLNFGIMNIEEQRSAVWNSIKELEASLEKLRVELSEKYGDVDINLSDGTYVERDSQVE